MSLKHKFTLFVILFGLTWSLYGQKQNNNWTFGTKMGLHFETGNITSFNAALMGYEGTATFSHPLTGDLIVYTNGVYLCNKNHDTIRDVNDIPIALLGNKSSTQGTIFIKDPSDPYHLFLFTIDDAGYQPPNYGIHYSTFRYNDDDDVMVESINNPLTGTDTIMSEMVAVVKNCVDNSYWIIFHQYQNDNFSLYKLDNTGSIIGPTVVSIGTTAVPPSEYYEAVLGIGFLRASTDGSMLALSNYGGCFIELFKFDKYTGSITDPIRFTFGNLPGGYYEQPYGISFSPSGTKLYVSTNYSPLSKASQHHFIYQYDLSTYDSLSIANSRYEMYAGTDPMDVPYAIQIAPDERVFISHGVDFDVVNSPELPGISANMQMGIWYPGCNFCESNIGLPIIIDSDFQFNINPFSLGDTIFACYGDEIYLVNPVDFQITWFNGSHADSILITNEGWYSASVAYDSCIFYDSVYVSLHLNECLLSDTIICASIDNYSAEINCGASMSTLFIAPDTTEPNHYIHVYTVTGNGCFVQDTVDIYTIITNVQQPFIPNVYTSNKDGVNDCFDFSILGSAFTIWVFNRWGTKLKEFDETDPEFCPENYSEGVYYMIVSNESPCLQETQKLFFHVFK
jgi:hypothetical protein